uniref:Uncharacterized protein n=1 Tax=Schistocephalus solidus TaxID=70667 RepID=A0A0X3Q685_SCHSO
MISQHRKVNENIDISEAVFQETFEQPMFTSNSLTVRADLHGDLSDSNREWSSNCFEAKNNHQENSISERFYNSTVAKASVLATLGVRRGRTYSDSIVAFNGHQRNPQPVGRLLSVSESRVDPGSLCTGLGDGRLGTTNSWKVGYAKPLFSRYSMPDLICGEIPERHSRKFRSLDSVTKENIDSVLVSPDVYNHTEHMADCARICRCSEANDDVFLPSTSYCIPVDEEIANHAIRITSGQFERKQSENADLTDKIESAEWSSQPTDTNPNHIVTSKDECSLQSQPSVQTSKIVPEDNLPNSTSLEDTMFYKKPTRYGREPFDETESERNIAESMEGQLKDGNGLDMSNNEQKEKNANDHDKKQLLSNRKLTESQDQRQILINEMQMLDTEMNFSRKSGSKLVNDNMVLNMQIQELQQELDAAKHELRAMKGRLERSELCATNLKKQLQVEENYRKTRTLKQKQALLNKDLEAKEKAEEAKRKQLSLEAQRQRLESLLSEVSRRASIAEQDREAIDRRHCRLRSMSVDLKKELDSTQLARDEALISTRELEHRLQERERQHAESKDALDKANREKQKMRRERDSVQEELTQLHRVRSELILQNIKLNEDLAAKKSDLSEVQSALNEKRKREKMLMVKLEDTERHLRTEEKKTERLEIYTKSLEKTVCLFKYHS